MNEVNATTHTELIAELMNPNNPKNEREHAAVREIELLQEALHAALQMIELLQEALPKPVLQGVDAVDTLTEQEAAVDTLTEQEAVDAYLKVKAICQAAYN